MHRWLAGWLPPAYMQPGACNNQRAAALLRVLQFFDNAAPGAPNQPYGLELFLASEASAVVEHTKQ